MTATLERTQAPQPAAGATPVARATGAVKVYGRGDTEFRGVLFWVNLARRDKQAEPRAARPLPLDPVRVSDRIPATPNARVPE